MTKEQVLFFLTRMLKVLAPQKVKMEEMAAQAVSFAERRRLIAQMEDKAETPEYKALAKAINLIADIPEDKFIEEEQHEAEEGKEETGAPIQPVAGAGPAVQAD